MSHCPQQNIGLLVRIREFHPIPDPGFHHSRCFSRQLGKEKQVKKKTKNTMSSDSFQSGKKCHPELAKAN